MTRLDDFASNVTSQFGENGCIEKALSMIGERSRVCVEFGAGDGISCSNTAPLWRDQGWRGFLVEPDPARYEMLEGNARLFDTIFYRTFVTPDGPSSIAALLASHDITEVDVMSIDVDGDDIFILEQLAIRPRLIVCEFNPTVPPHLALRPETLGSTFGASLTAIIRAAATLSYRFVGATYCNAFFVVEEEAAPFDGYETDPAVLFGPERYSYAVTDFAGRILLTGQPLPWGAREPYVLPLEGAPTAMSTDSVQQLRRGFESLWGPARWLPPDGMDRDALKRVLAPEGQRLVCIDVSRQAPATVDRLAEWASEFPYMVLRADGVLGLIREAS